MHGAENMLIIRYDLHLTWDKCFFSLLPRQDTDAAWKWAVHINTFTPADLHTVHHSASPLRSSACRRTFFLRDLPGTSFHSYALFSTLPERKYGSKLVTRSATTRLTEYEQFVLARVRGISSGSAMDFTDCGIRTTYVRSPSPPRQGHAACIASSCSRWRKGRKITIEDQYGVVFVILHLRVRGPVLYRVRVQNTDPPSSRSQFEDN